jgi:hypothetical protein
MRRTSQVGGGASPAGLLRRYGGALLLLLPAVVLGNPGSAKVLDEFSFRGPFGDVNPFTGARQISQWDLGGTATAHRSFVRLTAEMQGSKGWLISQQPFTHTEWSAMLELRASGTSPHLYGDGLAIWLVKASDHVEGPVFGREDKWNGLGLFFDTFQNIDHSHHHKHPCARKLPPSLPPSLPLCPPQPSTTAPSGPPARASSSPPSCAPRS